MTTLATRIYFIEDICRLLNVSRSTVERLRRHRAFPIKELPALDKRPRWSVEAVERYLASEMVSQQRVRRHDSR